MRAKPALARPARPAIAGVSLAVLLVVALGTAPPAGAGTLTWTNASGDGKFETPGNWSPAGPPGEADEAAFDGTGGTVTFDTSRRTGTFRVGAADVSLDLASRTWRLTETLGEAVVGTAPPDLSRLALGQGTVRSDPDAGRFDLVVGDAAGERGEVQIDSTATLLLGGDVELGVDGEGSLRVEGTLETDGAILGRAAGASGEATVRGSTAAWEAAASLEIGGFFGGRGVLTVDQGAEVTSGAALVALRAAAAEPSGVLVDHGASFTTDLLDVGQRGEAVVELRNDARLDGDLTQVGNFGDGRLNVFTQSEARAGVLIVASKDGAEGDVAVAGPQSKAIVGEQLLGNQGQATLTLADHGELLAGTEKVLPGSGLDLARTMVWGHAGGHAEALVRDPGSRLFVVGEMVLGDGGVGTGDGSGDELTQGELVVSKGATVSTGTTRLGLNGARGILDLRGGGTRMFTNEVVIGGSLEEEMFGAVLTGDDDGFGQVFISTGAELEVNGDFLVEPNATSLIRVDGRLTADTISGGVDIGGSGTVTGTVENNAGTVAPGGSAGTLSVDGSYIQSGAGRLEVELGEAFDKLLVSEDADLGGFLEVVLLDGFDDRLGPEDTFPFLEVGGLLGGAFRNAAPGARFNTADGIGSVVVDYDRAGGRVSVTGFRPWPAPAPPTAGLALMGVVPLYFGWRRRVGSRRLSSKR